MLDSADRRKLDRQNQYRKGSFSVRKFYRPGFLFLFLIFALLFPYRFEYSWAFFSSFSILDVTLVVLFMSVTLVAVARGRIAVGESKVFFVLLMPFLLAVISIIWSINISATFKSIVVSAAAVVVILLVVNLSAEYYFDRLSFLVIIIPFLLIVTSIASYLPGSPLAPEVTVLSQTLNQDGFVLSYHARLSHPFIGLSNSFATILAMFLPFFVLVSRAGIYKRSSLWLTILTFSAILATGSRGVLLAVVIVYMGLFLWKAMVVARAPTKGLVIVVMSLLIAATFVLINPDAQRHLSDRLNIAGVISRLEAFSEVFYVLNDNLSGTGSGVALSESSSLPLQSVHNSYLQNLLWFGVVGGTLMSLAMLAIPFLVLNMRVRTWLGQEAKRALAISVFILLLINLSQASWEGSVLRVWIYFLIGLGLVMVRKADHWVLEGARG